jgi:hypothetical protein
MGKKIEVTRDGAIFEIIDEASLPTYEEKGFKKVEVKKTSTKSTEKDSGKK